MVINRLPACQPSTLRMLIWPDASRAQNSIAAVSAEGSTVWVLIRRLNSSWRRSIAFVVRHASKLGKQVADPTGEVNADEAEQRTSDSGPHDTEHDVQEKPHLALHELLCEPTGNSAYDDGCNPADLLFFHWSPLLVGSEAIKIHFNPYVVVKQYVRTNAPQVFAQRQRRD